jgi:lipopolysaccharide exporter
MLSSLKSSAFKNMQWTGFSSTYVSVLQLLNTVILAIFLDPAQIGTMSALLLIIWFTQYISDGGMSPAIVHHEHNRPEILNFLFYVNILLAILLYLGVLMMAEPLSAFFNEPDMLVYIPISTISMVIASFGNQFKVILMKELRFDLIARQEMSGMTVNAIVSISLAYMGYGVWSMVIGHLCGTFVGNVILIANSWKFWHPGFKVSTQGLQPYMQFGMYQLGERISLFLNTRLDQMIIGSILGTSALGIYTVAHNLIISPTIRVNQIISLVMFSVFAKIQNDDNTVRKGYLKLVKLVTIINTPVMLGIAITAPLFIPILFDEKWVDSIYIIQILSIYALIRATGSPAGSLQMAKGRTDLGFKWNASIMLLSAPVLYFGATIGGINGVAYSLVIMHLVLFTPYWYLIVKPLIGPPTFDYMKAVFKSILPGALMSIIVFGIVYLLSPFSVELALIAGVFSGTGLYILFMFRFENDLVSELKSLILNKNSATL